jgi:hypothetical protein
LHPGSIPGEASNQINWLRAGPKPPSSLFVSERAVPPRRTGDKESKGRRKESQTPPQGKQSAAQGKQSGPQGNQNAIWFLELRLINSLPWILVPDSPAVFHRATFPMRI